MEYKTLLVQLDLNENNEGVLKVAGELADRFKAGVIGVAAAQAVEIPFDEYGASAEVMAADRAEIGVKLAACKAQFHEALDNRVQKLEWRCATTSASPAAYVAEQSRAADLIIAASHRGSSMFNHSRRVDIGQLAMMAGRPILLVPPGIVSLALRHVFIGWMDSREARRATADAMPLLKAAKKVTILEITSSHDQPEAEKRVKDVAVWLEPHGVGASPLVIGTGSGHEGYLRAELMEHHCDLLVAGAFAHSRLGEWIFGGVTQNILLNPAFCVLFSH
jgi:nucleotide-binding universal stress UspA family protein